MLVFAFVLVVAMVANAGHGNRYEVKGGLRGYIYAIYRPSSIAISVCLSLLVCVFCRVSQKMGLSLSLFVSLYPRPSLYMCLSLYFSLSGYVCVCPSLFGLSRFLSLGLS
jgi:hypothetical protein